jgi:periplasmic protein TonB
MRSPQPQLLSAFSCTNFATEAFATPEKGKSTTASLALHVAVLGALLWLASSPMRQTPLGPTVRTTVPGPTSRDLAAALRGLRSHDNAGHGSNHQLEIATADPLPRSSIQIVRPTLPAGTPHELAVPPTILDEQAPAILPPIGEIGVPSNRAVTDSAGRNGGNGIGDHTGNGVGNGGDGPGGEGYAEDGTGIRAAAMPTCLYCPEPAYSDEAREAKLQGMVTLRVLITADGRASSVQMVKGIGLGLDERAIAAVRSWRFKPARNATGKAVSDWIIVETVFRLF